jgi:hypothetical protein
MSEPTISINPAVSTTTPATFAPVEPDGNGVVPAKPSADSDPKLYTAEELEAARKQEKDKLYKRMETMQETVARLEAEAKERADKEAARRKEAEDIAKAKVESEMSAKDLLAQKETEWQNRFSQMESKLEQEQALREQESKFAQIMEFRQQVAQQYSDRIAPELLDLISGETPEELTASAEDLATRSERILAQTAEAMQTARQQMPTVRATAPASGENSGSQRVFSPDEIRGMSMSDYAKHRKSLLGGGAGGPSNRGLFG